MSLLLLAIQSECTGAALISQDLSESRHESVSAVTGESARCSASSTNSGGGFDSADCDLRGSLLSASALA